MSNLATPFIMGSTSRNSATGELIAHYAFLSADEVERIKVNASASRLRRATSMAARVATYRRLSRKLRDRSVSLAALINSEMGKTLAVASIEIAFEQAAYLSYSAEVARVIERAAIDGDR